jgi:hypothetical protein
LFFFKGLVEFSREFTGPGFFFVGRFFINVSIPWLVIGLFKFLMTSRFNFGKSCVSRNLFIYSSFSSLREYRFLKFSYMTIWISLVPVMIFPFSILVLLTQGFSFILLVNLAKGLLIFFLKNQLFSLLICHIVFGAPIHWLLPHFYYLFPSVTFKVGFLLFF